MNAVDETLGLMKPTRVLVWLSGIYLGHRSGKHLPGERGKSGKPRWAESSPGVTGGRGQACVSPAAYVSEAPSSLCADAPGLVLSHELY